MTRRRRLLRVYARIGRTYRAWAPSLLLMAAVVFIPLGFADALLHQVDTESLNVTEGFKLAAFLGALVAVTASVDASRAGQHDAVASDPLLFGNTLE